MDDDLHLPNDVVMDILSRLPLDKVGKRRALSKSHAKASHHSYYKELLAQRQLRPILDGFLFQTLHSGDNSVSFASPRPNSPPFNLTLDFLPGHRPKILAAAPNGLLLCETRKHHNCHRQLIYSVSKPSTKQFKGIPIPRTRFFTTNVAMFVLRSNPLHFKIIRLSENQRPKHPPLFSITVCEVFDSESWRWKRLDDIVRDSESKYVESRSVAVLASGSAHWKTRHGSSIFCFHFHSETWSIIDMPNSIVMEYNNSQYDRVETWMSIELVEYEGKLGLMRQFSERHDNPTELWVMDNYTNRIWTKKSDLFGSMPMALYGSDISMTWSDKVMFTSLETGSCRKLEEVHKQPRMVFPFLSDFEGWNFEAPARAVKPRTMAKILRKRLLVIENNVVVLTSFCLVFAHYNNYLCDFLFGMLYCILQSS